MPPAAFIAAVLGVIAAPEPASPPGPQVQVVGCAELSGPRMAELLAVEHAELSKVTTLRVELTCQGTEVVIAVDDGLTDKRLERTVDAPPVGTPGRDRELALATSSLIVASYLELYVPREQMHPPPPAPSSQAEVEAAARVVNEVLDARPRAVIQGLAGLRLRSLPEAFPVLQVELRMGGYLGRRGELFGRAAFEAGRALRDLGRVTTLGTMLGVGAALHLRPHAPVGLELFGSVSGGYARLAGSSTRPDVRPGVVDGVTAEVELGLGPEFRAGSFLVVLDARGGYTLPNPRGVVTGEGAVTLGGPWVGLGLRLGGALGQRPVGSGRAGPRARSR